MSDLRVLVCVTLTVSPLVILGILLVSTAYSTHLATFALCNSYKASNFFLSDLTLWIPGILGSINIVCPEDSLDLINPYVRADSIMGLQTVRAEIIIPFKELEVSCCQF